LGAQVPVGVGRKVGVLVGGRGVGVFVAPGGGVLVGGRGVGVFVGDCDISGQEAS